MTSQATPRPWEYKDGEIVSGEEKVIALANDGGCSDPECCGGCSYWLLMSEANACLIVRAVNCHDELVEALKVCLLELQTVGNATGLNMFTWAMNKAKQALSRAEGGEA